jgi:hypothetical protein
MAEAKRILNINNDETLVDWRVEWLVERQNFVDPISGAHTQRMDCNWGHVKTELVLKMRGTSAVLLPGHLAEYWWKKVHDAHPFNVSRDCAPIPVSVAIAINRTQVNSEEQNMEQMPKQYDEANVTIIKKRYRHKNASSV